MLIINVQINRPDGFDPLILEGDIGNVSSLAALSDYEFSLEDRAPISENIIRRYPRWSESVMGLIARCLALTEPDKNRQPLPADWSTAQMLIGLLPGGRGHRRNLVTIDLQHQASCVIVATANEVEIESSVTYQAHDYVDGWALIDHAIRMLMFGADILPAVKPLDVPVFHAGDRPYVRLRDMPEPARSVFAERQRLSGKPCINVPDANWQWDWVDWVNGQR